MQDHANDALMPPPPVNSFASDNTAGVSDAVMRALVDANRGAKEKTLRVITELMPPQDRQLSAVVRPFRVIH